MKLNAINRASINVALTLFGLFVIILTNKDSAVSVTISYLMAICSSINGFHATKCILEYIEQNKTTKPTTSEN